MFAIAWRIFSAVLSVSVSPVATAGPPPVEVVPVDVEPNQSGT